MPLRSNLASLSPVAHGDLDYDELADLGLQPDEVIDFSANSNPYGPHPAVLEALCRAVTAPNLVRYPDRECHALRQAIAKTEMLPTTYILPTNGANELIQLVALAFVTPRSQHLIIAPTFSEYARAIKLMGGMVHEYRPVAADLRFDLEDIAAKIRQLSPNSIWLCNPNNPTGQFLSALELAQLRAADPEGQALWVIDESYQYMVGYEQSVGYRWLFEEDHPNVIVIRSLTKEHGLAGLRLGYGLTTPTVVKALRTAQPAWSVNTLAQIAGVTALQPETLAQQRQKLAYVSQHALDLWQSLSTIGYAVLPTETTFSLIEVGQATDFRRALLDYNLVVRDCASFGLPTHIRIAAQLRAANEQLAAAMAELYRRKE